MNIYLTIYSIILFILWTVFGSFSTVLISRWHNKEWWILFWRSHCPHCQHSLTAMELIPIFSFLFQNGRCKSCKTTIPFFYPLAELLMGIIFVLMGGIIIASELPPIGGALGILLVFGFITGVYMLYDIRYTEIPDQIMIPGIILILVLLLGSLYFPGWEAIFFDRWTYTNIEKLVVDHLLWAWILYSFLYIQILIPGIIHCLKGKKGKPMIELIISYISFPIMMIVHFFLPRYFRESDDAEEIPAWIGWGDLRIALFIGLSLGTIHGVISFFFAYIIGSIVGILVLLKSKNTQHEIPFGPFLGLGWILAMVFHGEILDYIYNYINI